MAGAAVAILPDEEVGPWRPLFHWAIAIPHLLVTGVLSIAGGLAALGAALWVLVTGRVPVRLAEFQVFVVRERVRAYSHFFLLRTSYPPFPRTITAVEPGDDPQTHVEAIGPVRAHRWSPIVRLLVLIPHAIVLAPVGLILDLLYPAWMIAVSANGGWPPSLRSFLVRIEEWVASSLLYAGFATDVRPRFGFGSIDDTAVATSHIVVGTGSAIGVRTRRDAPLAGV